MEFTSGRQLPEISKLSSTCAPQQTTNPLMNHTQVSVLQLLDLEIEKNTTMLTSLKEQEEKSEQLCEEIRGKLKKIVGEKAGEKVLEAPKDQECNCFLQLIGFPRNPLFVRRRYELTFRLVSHSGQPLPTSFFCSVSIHQASPSAEEIKLTRKGIIYPGAPFIAGLLTKEFRVDQECTFERIVFMDISRDFPMSRVNLIVKCVSLTGVRPIFIQGVRIKARRKHPDEAY